MPVSLRISRTAQLPDPLRVARYQKAPELGPRVLFFSGGSALARLSRRLIDYTHNSIHLITPFDSGGSSAKLRQAFNMLAVGDLRNRLMALSDQSVKGNPAIVELFAHRFAKEADQAELLGQLESMVLGRDPMMAAVVDPLRKLIRNHLDYFLQAMPESFDLRGASIGNLVLVGGYLNNARHIDPVIFMFSKLAECRGVVRPTLNSDLHLAARLADGRLVVGQHLLTGREAAPLDQPISELYLTPRLDSRDPVHPVIREKVRLMINQAELICYPMGSFYSSLIANLLPQGVAEAVRATDCPKVYVPNTGKDSESVGLTVEASVETLLGYLRAGCPQGAATEELLDLVVVDQDPAHYPRGMDLAKIRDLGVRVVAAPLVTPQSAPGIDEQRLIEILLSLI